VKLADTTVNEKNITYPTVTKFLKKILEIYRDIAIKKRNNYSTELKTYIKAINDYNEGYDENNN
jgi:hypothetical protein